MKKTTIIEICICLAAFLLVNFLSHRFQAPITLNDGKGWDGVHYFKTAEQLLKHEPVTGEGPFCYRIGASYLAGLVAPNNLIHGFMVVNQVANVLTTILLMIWLRFFILDWRIRTLLTLLFLFFWNGPVRFIYWYAATTDNTMYTFLLLGLIGIFLARTRPFLGTAIVSVAVFIGVPFREVVLLLAVALFFVDNPIRFEGIIDNLANFRLLKVFRFPRLIYFAPLLLGIVSFYLVHQIVHQDNSYSFKGALLEWGYKKPWFSWLHGLFIAFGPMLVLALYNWRRGWEFLIQHQALMVYAAGFTTLAYIGGSDTERFWYWTMPVTYILLGKAMLDNRHLLQSKALVAVLAVAQILSYRLFWVLPDYPNEFRSPKPIFTVLSNKFQVLDLFSFHGRQGVEVISMIQYALFTVAIVWWLYLLEKKFKPHAATARASNPTLVSGEMGTTALRAKP